MTLRNARVAARAKSKVFRLTMIRPISVWIAISLSCGVLACSTSRPMRTAELVEDDPIRSHKGQLLPARAEYDGKKWYELAKIDPNTRTHLPDGDPDYFYLKSSSTVW